MTVVDYTVNLIIVLFSLSGIAILALNLIRGTGQDRIAYMIIMCAVAMLIVIKGIMIYFTSENKIFEMWVSVFLYTIVGLGFHIMYRMYKEISKRPAFCLVISIAIIMILTAITSIIDMI